MSDLISRQAVENITWEEPSYTDPLNVLTEIREKVRALPSVENKGEWIPVSERLPEDGQRVNITIQRDYTAYVTTATWDEKIGYFYNLGHAFDDVVAWMPLPSPWKGE